MYFNSETNKENSFMKVKRIKKYIDEHITEDLRLTEIADEFGMSVHYLCHSFKAHTGCTVLQYVNNGRLGLAMDYYKSGLNLLDAAIKAGFGHYSSFYRLYLKEFGVSPKKHQDLQNNK